MVNGEVWLKWCWGQRISKIFFYIVSPVSHLYLPSPTYKSQIQRQTQPCKYKNTSWRNTPDLKVKCCHMYQFVAQSKVLSYLPICGSPKLSIQYWVDCRIESVPGVPYYHQQAIFVFIYHCWLFLQSLEFHIIINKLFGCFTDPAGSS